MIVEMIFADATELYICMRNMSPLVGGVFCKYSA